MTSIRIPRAAWLVGLAMILPLATFAAEAPKASITSEAPKASIQALLTTTFTYQGTLFDGNAPANGFYDFDFFLYDAATNGTLQGQILKNNVQVLNGYLVINDMDFGDAFKGDRQWLQIDMRPHANFGRYTTLLPRVELQPTPYALSLRPGATVTGNPGNPILSLTGNSGDGLYAQSAGLNGVEAHSNSSNASGVYGENNAGGYGVAGRSTSGATSRAVWGDNTAFGTGVLGTSGHVAIIGSSNGAWIPAGDENWEIGVIGVAGGCAFPEGCNLGYGVKGVSIAAGTGVHGESLNGVGVVAVSNNYRPIEAYSNGGLRFYVDNAGNVRADGTFASPAADFAELLPSRGVVEPGDVLAIDPDGKLVLTTTADQTNVAGVCSTKPAFLGGSSDANLPGGQAALAVVGVVPVKVCDQNGPIRAGDLLVPSSQAGRAMRAGDHPVTGTVIGKALGSSKSGQASISMLLTTR